MLKTYLLSQRQKIIQLIISIVALITSASIGIITTLVGLQQANMPKAAPIMLLIALACAIMVSVTIVQIVYDFIKLITSNTTADQILTNIINENVRKDVTK